MHGSKLKFFFSVSQKVEEINIWNQGKRQPSKIVRFFLTSISHTGGVGNEQDKTLGIKINDI